MSWFLLDFLRQVNSWLVLCEVYGCTVVQDQCTVVALYYYITSLPVYPKTVHGHCTIVVLDTSNIVYDCIATLMECTVQCSAQPMFYRIVEFHFCSCFQNPLHMQVLIAHSSRLPSFGLLRVLARNNSFVMPSALLA